MCLYPTIGLSNTRPDQSTHCHVLLYRQFPTNAVLTMDYRYSMCDATLLQPPSPPPLNKKLLIERLIWKMTGIDFQLNICHSSFTSLIKMTNKMQLCRIIYYSLVPWLLYMFRAMLSLIIRSILTVITASGFIHMHCCRLLSWLSRNYYLCM